MSTSRWVDCEFKVYKPDAKWSDVGGVYIFTAPRPTGLLGGANPWRALYVGETESFKNRPLANHEKWPAAAKLGATHIHARTVEGTIGRKELERILRDNLKPRLNDV